MLFTPYLSFENVILVDPNGLGGWADDEEVVFGDNGLPPPANQDIAFLIHKYDASGDQQLDKKEFSHLLKELTGQKKYDKNSYKKKGKHS